MESLNQAGRGLLEVGSGDSPHGLQSRLEQLNESWEFVRCETERRQLELENRLSQVGSRAHSSFSFTCNHHDEVLIEPSSVCAIHAVFVRWRPLVFAIRANKQVTRGKTNLKYLLLLA